MRVRSQLRRWYFATLTIAVVVVVGLALSVGLQTERVIRDYRASLDRVGLDWAENAFNLLDATARDVVLKIHNNPGTILLSLAPSIDQVTPVFMRSFQRMQDMVLPFIHSINVIHVPTGRVITTDQGWYQVSGQFVRDLEEAYPDLPALIPLPLVSSVSRDGRKELLFAYLLKDRVPEDSGMERGVILLVQSAWFLDALAKGDDPRTGTRFVLYHPRLGLLGDGGTALSNESVSEHLRGIAPGESTNGEFRVEEGGTTYVVEHRSLGTTDLRLLRIRDESILGREIASMRVKVAGLALVFLLLFVATGYLVNRQVYTPYYVLVEEIRETLGNRLPAPGTDLELLTGLYENLRDEFSETGEDRVIVNCLRSLTQEELENPGDVVEVMNNRGIHVSADRPGSLYLISLDLVDESFSTQEQPHEISYPSLKYRLRMGIRAAVAELAMGSVDFFVRRGVVLLLVYPQTDGPITGPDTGRFLHTTISSVAKASVSIAHYSPLEELEGLRTVYLDLTAALRTRFVTGPAALLCVGSPRSGPTNEDRTTARALRSKIIEALAERTILPQEYATYFDTLRNWVVEAVQDEVNSFSLALVRSLTNQDANFAYQETFKSLINQPTLSDFRNVVEGMAEERGKTIRNAEARHLAAVDAAREIIEKRYSDPGLGIVNVASELHMSPNYFGMIFKSTVGTPFFDYLTVVRIQEAARLLQESHLTVQEIMAAVGIPSESTFFRRFREFYSLSPQLYRQQMAFKRIQTHERR